MPTANLTRLALALTVSIALIPSAAAQLSTASQAPWAGWARCEINVSGQGYSDQQTHTWMITGGTPTVSGAFRVYPATWSVVGGGSLQRTQGKQTLRAQWSTTAQNLSAPLAVFVRASDGRMFIQARHAQVRAPRSVNGYQQLTIDGKAQTPGTIASEAFEWSFPVAEVSRPKPGVKASANGSSTPFVNGKVGVRPGVGRARTAPESNPAGRAFTSDRRSCDGAFRVVRGDVGACQALQPVRCGMPSCGGSYSRSKWTVRIVVGRSSSHQKPPVPLVSPHGHTTKVAAGSADLRPET